MSQNNNAVPQKSRSYLNAVLTVHAVLLGVIAVNGIAGPSRSGVAVAQPPESYAGVPTPDGDDPSGRVSAAEQRKQMIGELRTIASRLDRIEGTLNKGLSVKVTSMPPIPGLSNSSGEGRGEPKPESRIEPKGK